MSSLKIKVGNGTVDMLTGKYESNAKKNVYQSKVSHKPQRRVNVDEIRQKYKEGMVVRLIYMNDKYAVNSGLRQGSIGRIRNVDDIGTIHVVWDSGSTLGLIEGVDKFEIVS